MQTKLLLSLLGLAGAVMATPARAIRAREASAYPLLSAENNFASDMMKLANSTGVSAVGLDKRQPGGVYICTDWHWGGTCGYAKQPWDDCIRLTDPYYHTISSIGPDDDNAIVFYSDFNCASSDTYTIFSPGSDDLNPTGWNDRIGSFRVRQLPDKACIANVDNGRLPGVNCQRCCNGCQRSGQDCCPPGYIC